MIIGAEYGPTCSQGVARTCRLLYPSLPSVFVKSDLSPTVFVVDDDDDMRASLETLLNVLGFAVRAFSSAGSFSRYYATGMPGCLVLDIRMPRQSGLDLYEQMLREGKKLPVVFITAHADVPMAVAAMKTGALEFLEKPFDRQTLLERVQTALALDAQWRDRDAAFSAVEQRICRLSERERETLELVLAGASNKAMAEKLFLTERAV
ncbi:unnamed protein product, partial [marine sediment metagenome]